MPAFIRQLQGKGADPHLAGVTAAASSSVTVDVLNGTDTVGLAGRNADQLRKLGFKVNAVDSTDAASSTVIEYPSGKEAQAKAVSLVVKDAKLVQSTVTRVTLVLGANHVQVKGLGTTPAHKTTAPAKKKPAKVSVATQTAGLGCIN